MKFSFILEAGDWRGGQTSIQLSTPPQWARAAIDWGMELNAEIAQSALTSSWNWPCSGLITVILIVFSFQLVFSSKIILFPFLWDQFSLQQLVPWLGFPGGSDGKESACNAGDGLGRSLGEGMATLSSMLAWRISWTEWGTTVKLTHYVMATVWSSCS